MTDFAAEPRLIAEMAGIVRKAAKIRGDVCITARSRLVEDLGIDSLDLVGVILEIQDRFGIVIDEDAVPHLCRVADLAAHLTTSGEAAGAQARSQADLAAVAEG
jgi:acyl carrier protein